MGRVDAWQCENKFCGMISPGGTEKEPPPGWFVIYYHQIDEDPTTSPEVTKFVCSDKCASQLFTKLPAKKIRRKPKEVAPPIRNAGKHLCPECGKLYDQPQHLGRHRKQIHGVPSKRDLDARQG